jgi:regulator of protease activity HflC (stomatin/prohibitin superfamily)
MKTYGGSGLAIVFDVVAAAIVGLIFLTEGSGAAVLAAALAFLFLLALSIRVVAQWNRMPVLRLGRYQGIIGPGFIMIIPFFETTPFSLDLRVINTTFSAEQTLTKDNVPVNVDAILFWQILDPEQATLNVQYYITAVLLAAQTAMRDVIGKSTLSEMLAGRDEIGKDIGVLIEDRVAGWGIKAISVEIRDVKIPQALQDAMARVATAEREKMARVTLAESETLAADKMIDAAKKYEKNPYAMQLRSLNMMYEVSINGRNQIIFIPTESRGFSLPTPIGLLGVDEIAKAAKMRRQKNSVEKEDD